MSAEQKPRSIKVHVALIMLVILIFLFSCYRLIFHFGADISGQIIQNIVREQSANAYTLSYNKIDISLISKKLKLNDVQLQPYDKIDSSISKSYKLFIPEVEITLFSILDIYTKRELSLEGITVTNPAIEMSRWRKDSIDNNFSLEAGELYQLINGYLQKFSIDSLSFNQGSISYTSYLSDPQYKIALNELDFQINNLLIDSTQQAKRKIFGTDNINIRITNQAFDLADSIHAISFDEIILSTKSKNLYIENLFLKQRENLKTTFNPSENYYDIAIPKMSIDGIDFQEAYSHNKLRINTLKVDNPTIKIWQNGSYKDVKENRITILAHKLFDIIEVDQFQIEKASTHLALANLTGKSLYSSDKTDIYIESFHLDSVNFMESDYSKFFKHISFISLNQCFTLPDSSHSIIIDTLHFDTKESLLDIGGILISPLKSNNYLKAFANINGISLTRFDLISFITDQSIIGDKLIIDGAIVDINSKSTLLKNSHSIAININEIVSKKSNISFTSKDFNTSIKNWDFSLHDIHSVINDDHNRKDFFNLTASLFESGQLSIGNNYYKVQNLEISNDFRMISGNDVTFENDSVSFNTPDVQVFGFDLTSLQENNIQFDSAHIVDPIFKKYLSKFDKKQFGYRILPITFKKLNIINGYAQIHQSDSSRYIIKGVSSTISNFNNANSQLVFDLDFQIDSLISSTSLINGQNFNYNSIDSALQIGSLKYSNISSLSDGLDLELKKLNLQKVNLKRLLSDSILIFGKGSSEKLNVKVHKMGLDTNNHKIKIPIQFDEFCFGGDEIKYHSSNYGFSLSNYEVEILNYNNESTELIPGILKLKNGENFYFSNDKKSLIANIKELQFDTDGNINAVNIKLENENHQISGRKAILRQVALEELFLNNRLIMDSLILENFDFTLQENNANHFISENDFKIWIGKTSVSNSLILLPNGIKLNDVWLDLDTLIADPSNTEYTLSKMVKKAKAGFGHINYVTSDSLYTWKAKSITLDLTENQAIMEGLRLSPNLNRGAFQRKIIFQKDWFDGSVNSITFDGLDYDKLIFDRSLIATKIKLSGLDLDTHRDKRKPLPSPLEYKELPQNTLKKLPFALGVDTIQITDSFVSHSEISENGDRPGVIFFRDLNGMIYNLSNIPERLSKNERIIFKSKGILMNTGDFIIQVKFDMKDPSTPYNFTGRVGNMNLTELNRFLEPTAFVQIKDGNSKTCTFNFAGNDDYAMGEMRFYYDDLKISVLSKETYNTKGLGPTMKSFFANTFVVNSRNPHLLIVREGDIFFERDKEKSIFNFWGKSLLSGVISSIGATNNKKEIRQKNEELKKALEQKK